MQIRLLLLATVSTSMVGCSTPVNQPLPQAAKIEVAFSPFIPIEDCQWKGQVTGSEGHWYSYLFYPNDTLIEGAVNALRNNAHEIGGNTVLLAPPHDFATSVSYLGTVYSCPE